MPTKPEKMTDDQIDRALALLGKGPVILHLADGAQLAATRMGTPTVKWHGDPERRHALSEMARTLECVPVAAAVALLQERAPGLVAALREPEPDDGVERFVMCPKNEACNFTACAASGAASAEEHQIPRGPTGSFRATVL